MASARETLQTERDPLEKDAKSIVLLLSELQKHSSDAFQAVVDTLRFARLMYLYRIEPRPTDNVPAGLESDDDIRLINVGARKEAAQNFRTYMYSADRSGDYQEALGAYDKRILETALSYNTRAFVEKIEDLYKQSQESK